MIQTFTNAGAITIGDSVSPPTAATPYPSNITVFGMPSYTVKVTITFNDFGHTFSNCVDMLLVGPTGFVVVLMSGAGTGATTGLTITLDDQGASLLPQTGALTSGTFIPTPYQIMAPTDFPGSPPAAVPPPSAPDDAYLYTGLDAFIGLDPNGTWSLYISNECNGDTGEITNGWSLTIEAV